MEISDNVVVILAIIAIIISVASTYIVIDNTNNVPSLNADGTKGTVGVTVVRPQSGQVGVNVINPNEEVGEL